ncbi:hypothetical protein PRJ39_11840 [Lysobacter enzymogenes]|uniref:hypothetical protein n=1 Tax=Lysobacter enzymogenes TaxID=69 RepID=UPI003747A440
MPSTTLRNALLAAILIPAALAPAFVPAHAAKPSKSKAAKAAKAAAPKNTLKPELVAELYARVSLRQDAEATAQLNDYLKPLHASGENAIVLTDPAGMDAQYDGFADAMLEDMPKVDKKKAKPAVAAAIKRVNLLASGAECRSVSSREYANEYVKNGRIAEVEMQCTVPALGARLQEVLASKGAPAKLKTKKLLEGVAEFDRALGQAGSRTIPAKLTLYASAKGQPWNTGSADDIVETVHNGMYGAAAE